MRAFSAPGKAFLAGGYLVLFPEYYAYVVALSARMHAVIESETAEQTTIEVRSPQFNNGKWTYSCENGQAKATGAKNPFVQAALTVVLGYAGDQLRQRIVITLFSDDGYHSQTDRVQREGGSDNDRFHWHEGSISEVPKTGLGSSAALTVAVVAALLSAFSPELDFGARETVTRVHNLAQLAHSMAQNKIGSGFDVASASFGSILYRRYPPSTLEALLGADASTTSDYKSKLQSVIDAPWDIETQPRALPQGLSLLMGDVHTGSETPKLVSTVLAWRKANPDRALEVWTALNTANMQLVDMITDFQAGKTDLAAMQALFREIRRNLQIMTRESGAAIEPPEQTTLLDACMEVPGVVGGVVPGAGGFDAICLLVLADEVDNIKRATAKHPAFANVSWLDLHEEGTGLREESVSDYSQYL